MKDKAPKTSRKVKPLTAEQERIAKLVEEIGLKGYQQQPPEPDPGWDQPPPEWKDEAKPKREESLDAMQRRLDREQYEKFHPKGDGNGHTAEAPRKRKRITEATELNVFKALREEPGLYAGELFKHDTFSGRTLLMHPIAIPGVDPPKTFKPTDITDIHTSQLMVWLQANSFSKVSVSRTAHAIELEADRNSFSSARRWLLSLPVWDGKVRLDNFWIDVCGTKLVEDGGTEAEAERRWKYLSATGRAFFISIVARVMRPGCKADFSPVLEGPQGTLKSSLLRAIAVNDEWFSDCMPRDLGNKDARSHLAGKLIVELAEMHQMKATQVDTLKGFLTVQEDKFRPSYGRNDITLKRQCVFVGTTNRIDYFSDETGNRRFWPIQCGVIDLDLAHEIMPQLYAEALTAFRAGEHWWLTPEIEEIAGLEQDDRITDDPWEEGALVAVAKRRDEARGKGETFFYVSTVDCLQMIEVKRELWDQGKQHRVALILRRLGGKNMKLPRVGNLQKRGFRFVTEPKRPK